MPFLKWALQPPGYKKEWHVGVRSATTATMFGFITGIPVDVHLTPEYKTMMAEINFLCVHKQLRSKRLAPVLIKEITRRVNLENMWQAVYTAGVELPKPVSTAQYWYVLKIKWCDISNFASRHRTLQTKKLMDIGFTRKFDFLSSQNTHLTE
jgi:glycylpeptide N-tetradecanoyltransferase